MAQRLQYPQKFRTAMDLINWRLYIAWVRRLTTPEIVNCLVRSRLIRAPCADEDQLRELKADLRTARGAALLVETVAAAWDEGRMAAPQRDWQASRLGPMPPESMATVRKDAFEAVLAACGCPPSRFMDAGGTAQREALRRWHLGTVMPLARLLETELTAKLEITVGLKFDNNPLDLAGPAQSFQKFVAGGVPVNEALALSGLMADDG